MSRREILSFGSVMAGLLLGACSGDGEGSSNGASPVGTGGFGIDGGAGQAGSAGSLGGSGGSSESGGSGGSGGTGTSGTGGVGGDAGDAGDAGSGGNGPFQGGHVAVMQSVMTVAGVEYASYSFSAGFSRSIDESSSSNCEILDDGPCRVTDCTFQSSDAGAPSYETVSAGVIQLTGASKPLTLLPDGSGTYAVVSDQERLWNGGETLTLVAAGDVVPAFQETLYAAAPVILTSPSLPAPGTPISLSTSQPLTIGWTGGFGGVVRAMLSRTISSATTRSVSIMCSFNATSGSGTVPASVMASIPPGPDGVFQVLGGDSKTVEPSGWTIMVQEYVPAVTTSGAVASVLAVYQ